MTGISTHVLDTSKGLPAEGVRVIAERRSGNSFVIVGEGVTDDQGRIPQLLRAGTVLEAGIYRLTFYVEKYFEGQDHFYSEVTVSFLIGDPSTHYHVPLLLSAYGYTTYRGS